MLINGLECSPFVKNISDAHNVITSEIAVDIDSYYGMPISNIMVDDIDNSLFFH